ncbi:MAG: hypothetical protein KBD01_13410 [Acidobacteria bacterium]|nr:hypothetical protein [Acidobacteriota bacterium]
MTSSRRSNAVLAVLLLAAALPALATDYYVRTDGNDSNAGTSNSSAGAWRTVKKCVSTVTAGNRCLIQPGTYLETSIVQANAGVLDGTGVATCSCTKGSTAISCTGTVPSSVSAGKFVQCQDGYGFSWSKVQSVSGGGITLAEPYRGKTTSGNPLDVARFVEILGQGAGIEDTVISGFRSKPSGVTWTKESGLSCTWSYTKNSSTDPAWTSPKAFRENVPDSEWDLRIKNTNGRDTFIYMTAGKCPCSKGTIRDQVESVPGSWADDSGKVYLQTRSCQDPNTRPIQAGAQGSGALLDVRKAYTVVENLTLEAGGQDDGYTNVDLYIFPIQVGGSSNIRYSKIRANNGRAYFDMKNGMKDVRIEHFRALSTGRFMGDTTPTKMSGVHFYNFEVRGGYTNGMSTDNWSGNSADDPLVFDRFFMHRTLSQYRNNICGAGGNYYDCSNKNWSDEQYGVHGVYWGTSTAARALDHIVFQNCVVEITADGIGIFNGAGATDITFRNCTFGVSMAKSGTQGNYPQEVAIIGNTVDRNYGAKFVNNVFYCDEIKKDCTQQIVVHNGNFNSIRSDYNLWLTPYNATNMGARRLWAQNDSNQVTLATAINTYDQERNSLLVCGGASCSSSVGRVYNDGTTARSYFVDTSITDGDPTDYTPTSSNRGVNAGNNAECPTEDFYGRPRNDGACDIGAVEYQGGTPDTTPPSPVTNFSATSGDSQVTLSWKHSTSSDNRGTLIRFKTTGYPSGPTDGSIACDKTGAAGASDSCTHTGLTNGTTYYYTAYSYDAATNYGSGVNASATPNASNAAPGNVNNNHRTDTR